MPRAKIAISVDKEALAEIDALVAGGVYPNRSRAIEVALEERIAKHRRTRLARQCALLNPADEQALAEERFDGDAEWPEY